MSKHTPIPYTVGPECHDGIRIQAGNDTCSLGTIWGLDNRANAEFIVHACNCHDKLLRALEAAKAELKRQAIAPRLRRSRAITILSVAITEARMST